MEATDVETDGLKAEAHEAANDEAEAAVAKW